MLLQTDYFRVRQNLYRKILETCAPQSNSIKRTLGSRKTWTPIAWQLFLRVACQSVKTRPWFWRPPMSWVDSLVGMALVLHHLSESRQTITECVNSFPRFSMIKEKLACPSDKIAVVLRMISREYANYPIDARDGIKVTLPEGWFLVRGSNTEPIIRVVAESEQEAKAREIVAKVFARV